MKIFQVLLHSFIGDFLGPNSTVIDLGANRGEFSCYIANQFGSLVYAVEPVPDLFNQIPENPKIQKINCGIAAQSGVYKLNLSPQSCATIYPNHNSEAGDKILDVHCLALEEFIKNNKIQRVDLIKVDIEGAEIKVLEGLKPNVLLKVNQMTVEFHDFLWPELGSRVANIKKKLTAIGFYCIPFSFFNNGDVLFIRKNLISYFDYLYIKYIISYPQLDTNISFIHF